MNNTSLKNIGLYFITDSRLTRKSVIEDVKSAVKAGVKIIQYREKNKPAKEMVQEANMLSEICRQNNAVLLINDRIDIALATNAGGVHLGQEDMPYEIARRLLKNKIIGLTAHSVKEAVRAEKIGADYIGISPIFETKTKLDAGKAAGIKLIERVKAKVKIPIIAIGGIDKENLPRVIKAGADSIAAISAIITKDDVKKKCSEFIEIIKKSRKEHK